MEAVALTPPAQLLWARPPSAFVKIEVANEEKPQLLVDEVKINMKIIEWRWKLDLEINNNLLQSKQANF